MTGVPETMLQTVFARAQETQKQNHKIADEKAVELVSRLDYDFSLAKRTKPCPAVSLPERWCSTGW